jgi:hypothetical protein
MGQGDPGSQHQAAVTDIGAALFILLTEVRVPGRCLLWVIRVGSGLSAFGALRT